jgi:hypothetical protein
VGRSVGVVIVGSGIVVAGLGTPSELGDTGILLVKKGIIIIIVFIIIVVVVATTTVCDYI